jgi:hypothetical protein
MRLKLVRDNDDPKLLSDLERLAGREPVVVEEAPPAPEDEAPAPEPPFDDPFVRGFVRASVHLKRYLPFYVGAAVWALTMLLIQPLGKGGPSDVASASGPGFAGQAVPAATVSDDSAAAVQDLGADAIAAPTFETVTGASFSDSSVGFDDLSGTSDTEFAGSDSSSSTYDSSDFSTDTTISFDDTEFDEPERLTITKSGYASATGGTPLEQQPANGALPVAATGGQDSKRSFISLSGEGTQLKLKQSADGNIQPETAVIKICKLTSADWKAERGQALNSSPAFDPACSTGSVLDGVWTFELSSFSEADREQGLTITPGAGTALTFQVNFDPVPEPPESA